MTNDGLGGNSQGPGGSGFNLIKLRKHNRTQGSTSISESPYQKAHDVLNRSAISASWDCNRSLPGIHSPTALALAEANATSASFFLPLCLFCPLSIPQREKVMIAFISIALQWVLPKPTLILQTWSFQVWNPGIWVFKGHSSFFLRPGWNWSSRPGWLANESQQSALFPPLQNFGGDCIPPYSEGFYIFLNSICVWGVSKCMPEYTCGGHQVAEVSSLLLPGSF